MEQLSKLCRTDAFVFSLLALLFVLSGCASKTTYDYKTYNELAKKTSKGKEEYELITDFSKIPEHENLKDKMAPGFLFYLAHPSDEKLEGRYRVDFNGLLRLPYNVRIDVRGKTYRELRQSVLKAYSKFFQRGVENVDFKLLRRDYLVEVRGFVKDSGRFYVNRKDGVDKLIDKAGGLTGELQEKFYKASIQQQGASYAVSLNQYFQNSEHSNVFSWTGGDKIFISELDESEMSSDLPIVTVLGGVKEPGKTLYKDQAHLFYYLGKSGGAIDNLDYDESYIIRTNSEGITKIKFNLTEMEAVPAVAPNDIILLQGDKRTTTDIVFERVTQIATVLTSILLVLVAL